MEMRKKVLKGLGILALFILILCIENAVGDVTSTGSKSNTQSNSTGTNTLIDTYESATTYQSGSSSNTTTNNDTNNSTNTKTAVNPASAPSMSVYGQSSCVIPLAAGVTVIGFSGSFGSYYVDPQCEMRLSVSVLAKLGMKVAAIARACQDENIWKSMMMAGSPCPVDGLIGDKAKARWKEVGGFHRIKQVSSVGKRSMAWNK